VRITAFMQNGARPKLDALTSLRFFAAMHVVIFHLRGPVRGPQWYQKIASVGHLGVSFFFVLSGFILVYTYADSQVRRYEFWQARFARIYPAYAVALLACFPHFWATEHSSLSWNMAFSCALTIALLQAWSPQTALTWNPVAWSLSAEAFFYFVFPALLAWLKKRQQGLLAVIIGSWLLSLATAVSFFSIRPAGMNGPMGTDAGVLGLTAIKYNPLVRLPEFVIGMAVGLLYLRGAKSPRLGSAFALGGIAAFALVVATCDQLPPPLLQTGVLAPIFAAVIFGVATQAGQSRDAQSVWIRCLNWRGLLLLGNASYSLYLLHDVIIWSGLAEFGTTFLHNLAGIVLLLAACIGASIACTKLVEEPLRERLRPKLPRPTTLSWTVSSQAANAGD